MNLYPDPNCIAIGEELKIQAWASDLDGITDVWAVINATYSPPVFSGDPERPIVDLPRIDLQRISEGVYEGTYSGFTYTGPYSLLVFARDTKGNVSLPSTYHLNVSGEEHTRALLIGGWDKDLYDLSTLLSHAQWVLREKRFSQIEPLTEPTLEEIESTLNNFDPNNTNQLFVYLLPLLFYLPILGGKCIPGLPILIRSHPVLFKSKTLSP